MSHANHNSEALREKIGTHAVDYILIVVFVAGTKIVATVIDAEADALGSTPLGPLRPKPKPSIDELPLE